MFLVLRPTPRLYYNTIAVILNELVWRVVVSLSQLKSLFSNLLLSHGLGVKTSIEIVQV